MAEVYSYRCRGEIQVVGGEDRVLQLLRIQQTKPSTGARKWEEGKPGVSREAETRCPEEGRQVKYIETKQTWTSSEPNPPLLSSRAVLPNWKVHRDHQGLADTGHLLEVQGVVWGLLV
jgi:hypothetical protein